MPQVAIDIFLVLRPRHWIKNVVVLFPVPLAQRYAEVEAWQAAVAAMVAFCLVSSTAYILNDIRDREADRLHPHKKNRPLAAGRIGIATALGAAAVCLIAAAAIAAAVNTPTLTVVGFYFLLQVAYSLKLKQIVLIDVMCIAAGFVLRADAGAAAITVETSPWLIICTFTLCLFMGFCKRQGELNAIADAEDAVNHRRTLQPYTPQLLSQLVTISAAVSVVAYVSYTLHPRTVEAIGDHYLMVYTVPIVIYGVFRFAMLTLAGRQHDPTELILTDRPFQAAVLLWCVVTLAILLFGPELADWLAPNPHG